MLTGPKAIELLKDCPPNIKSVTLGTKSFGKDAAIVAADRLGSLTTLKFADLSDIIAGRPEIEALEVLQVICGALPKSILELDLSENALGEKGIRALEGILSQLGDLEKISFQNNGLSELSIKLLSDYLPTSSLKSLVFHNNMSGSGGAIAAAAIVLRSIKLEEFRMSSSRVAANGGLALIPALANATHLKKLNLSDSMFDKACASELLKVLGNVPNLTDLILRDTGLGVPAVITALGNPLVSPMLSVLDLSGLEFEPDMGSKVGGIIAGRPRLRKLWLDDNELASAGVIAMCRKAAKSMIEMISIESNAVGRNGAIALVRFALTNPSILTINLNSNSISEEAVESMKRLLAVQHRTDVLGSLDENEPEDDEDDEEEEDDDEEDDDEENDDIAVDSLADALNAGLQL